MINKKKLRIIFIDSLYLLLPMSYYLSISFIHGSFNPNNWMLLNRIFFSVYSLLLIYSAYLIDTLLKEK